MLKYSLCLPQYAKLIDEAVKRTIDKGTRTPDIGGTASTSEVGSDIAAEFKALLGATE